MTTPLKPFVRMLSLFAVFLTISASLRADGIIIQNGQKIAFLGDSITKFGTDKPDGYVRLAMQGLEVNGVKAQAIPAGVAGNTSRDMLARLADVLAKKPDWMTLSCGVNDVGRRAHSVTLEEFKSNVTSIIDQAQAAGIRVIVLTPTPIHEELGNDFNKTEADFIAALLSVAAEKKCVVADLNAEMQTAIKTSGKKPGRAFTLDGIHMNPHGNKIMATGVLRAFGLNDAQIQKASESWVSIPHAWDIEAGYPLHSKSRHKLVVTQELTQAQYEKLEALNAGKAVPTSLLDQMNNLFADDVKTFLAPQGTYADVDAIYQAQKSDEILAQLRPMLQKQTDDLLNGTPPPPPPPPTSPVPPASPVKTNPPVKSTSVVSPTVKLTTDAASNLISTGIGEKSIEVIFSASGAITGGTATATLRRYGATDAVEPALLAIDKIVLKGDVTSQRMLFHLPAKILGLYQLTVQLNDADGTVLKEMTTMLAAVSARKEVGPADWGVCTHFAQGKGTFPVSLELIRQAGFSRIRDEVYWDSVEQKSGVLVIPEYAEYITKARSLGISPLVILDMGNAKAYPQLFATNGFPDTDEKRAHFVAYVQTLVRHFRDCVTDWEVWNEPSVSPDVYTPLLKQVHSAIKEIDPKAEVVSCGGGGSGGGPGGDYITGVVQDGGLAAQEGFSIHPYMAPDFTPDLGYPAPTSPVAGGRVSLPLVLPHLKGFIDGHRKPDGSKLSVWITEYGWFTSPVTYEHPEWMQAAYFARSYLLVRRFPVARALFWYDFQDDGANPADKECNFGLIRADYSPKPAYVAAAVLASTLENRAWSKALIETDDVKVFAYGYDPDTVLAGWTTGTKPQTVRIAPQPGAYVLRDWSGLDHPVTISDQGYAWAIDCMPQYLIPAWRA